MDLSLYNILQFMAIGIAVGFIGGFLGVGGGIIMIPLLIYWAFPAMQVSPETIVHLSFGTSLAIIIPTALSSSIAHTRAGNVSWRTVGLLVSTGLIASFSGAYIAAQLKGLWLKAIFGVLLVILSLQMFLQKGGPEDSAKVPRPGTLSTLGIGFGGGLFSGFFGLGGGVVLIPLMVRFLRFSIYRSVGISISFVVFAALVGTAGYIYNGWGQPNLPPHSLGYVYEWRWLLAGIPSILFAQWGAHLARRTKPLRLRRAFALLLAAVGLRMLF